MAQPTGESLRARWRRWMRPPRRLSFTTSGKYFVLLTLGIGFGAINTGDNLLFLLLGMMLSLILASGVLSEAVIRRLGARRSAPGRIFAGAQAPGALELQNPSRWPSLSIEVAERRARGLDGPHAGREVGPQSIPWWKFWRRKPPADELHADIARAYTLRIEPGEHQQMAARYYFATRGRFELVGLDIITRFPFGFFEKRRELDQADVVIVFPTALPAERWLADVHARFGDIPRNRRGPGEDFFGLRDYRPGEDQRRIHWKSSARRGEIVVRETEANAQRAVDVWLVNCTGKPAHQRHLVTAEFEAGLGRTAGMIQALLASGWRVGLGTLDGYIGASDASNHLDRLLTALALVELRDGAHALPLGTPKSLPGGAHTTPGTVQTPPGGGRRVARIVVGLAAATAAAGTSADLVLTFEGADATADPPYSRDSQEAQP